MLQAELKVLAGRLQGRVIPLTTKKFLVGREQDCHLRPNSELVSRHHCVFVKDDFTVRLRDLGSTNGTRVNGELVRTERVLQDGDRVSIGKLELEFLIRQTAEVTTAVPAAVAMVEEATSPPAGMGTVVDLPMIDLEPLAAPPASSETAFELPVYPGASVTQTNAGLGSDTAILGGGAPPAMAPAMMPGMAPAMMGGYPAMPQGYPQPMGYPQAYPGYPQAGFGQPAYAPQGFAQPGYAPQMGYPMGYPAAMPGYPMMPGPQYPAAAPASAAPAVPEARPEDANLKLPDPETTGVKTPPPAPPPAPAVEGAAPPTAEVKPSNSAADIIKQYMQRRQTK